MTIRIGNKDLHLGSLYRYLDPCGVEFVGKVTSEYPHFETYWAPFDPSASCKGASGAFNIQAGDENFMEQIHINEGTIWVPRTDVLFVTVQYYTGGDVDYARAGTIRCKGIKSFLWEYSKLDWKKKASMNCIDCGTARIRHGDDMKLSRDWKCWSCV